jgi:uncharacterized protein YkwD
MQLAARILVALFLVASMSLAGGPDAHAHAPCSGAGATLGSRNLPVVERATLCLINAQREAHGLAGLHADRRLRQAALRHSRDMVNGRYFAHTSPGGQTFVDRIRDAGYLLRSRSWSIAENIAWGQGAYGTPRGIVRAWMKSPPHRRNILTPGFRGIGVGIAPGNPSSGRGGATYTTDFGNRA